MQVPFEESAGKTIREVVNAVWQPVLLIKYTDGTHSVIGAYAYEAGEAEIDTSSDAYLQSMFTAEQLEGVQS